MKKESGSWKSINNQKDELKNVKKMKLSQFSTDYVGETWVWFVVNVENLMDCGKDGFGDWELAKWKGNDLPKIKFVTFVVSNIDCSKYNLKAILQNMI